ncbi:hypothetical protein WICPIJ_000773 [Wickerhamomyces pijperi]|uniref:Uncharacterized protein n=1 Tax=Wickerhamomyces pijperi TaxID=599730 RepID=A0A9P8TQJ3_WICPI|nr:hypothetical protein WICPIJ_000773 [Wickerhamomyces pijperi]
MRHSHTRWNGMRIDNQIWNNTFCGERHIFTTVSDTNGTLLTVSGGELITDLWHLCRSHSNLDEFQTIGVSGDQHLIDNTVLCGSQRSRGISLGMVHCSLTQLFHIWSNWRGLTDDDIFTRDTDTWFDQPIRIQFLIRTVFQSQCVGSVWLFKLFDNGHTDTLFMIHVRSEEQRSE